jgi:AhpD family alkylhydroperoxidase
VTTSAKTPPRLPLIGTSDDALVREAFDKLAKGRGILNLHRMMAHCPPLMKASGDMAMAFRSDAKLTRATAEIVVLRTAQVIDCDYVYRRHLPLARACGVTERQIAEVAQWRDSDAFAAGQKSAIEFAEQAAKAMPVRDSTFTALQREFSPREIVELTMLIGFYVSTAVFIKALAIPDDEA